MKSVAIIVIIGIVIAAIGGSMLVPEPEEAQEIEKPVRPVQEKESAVISQASISQDCSGDARCITGKVTQVIDGDTIKVDGQSIRFALASAPELDEFGGNTARDFISELCPVGSTALVDEDDGQTRGSYGRIIGVIICNGMNLNSELLDSNLGYVDDRFCDESEFSAQSWAQKHGCSSLISESEMQPAKPSGFQVDVYGQQQVRRGTTHDITVDVTRDGNPASDSLVIITIETMMRM